jgi:hypothetical protein
MRENDIVREINALTIMPLPVRIPASWYDTLPKILPLIRWSTEQPRFFMAEELIDIFLQKWRKILIRRDGDYVWIHLGGVACYEVIPNFIKGVKYRIDSSDAEFIENGGEEALIQRWRICIQELGPLDDNGVKAARDEILGIIQPETWSEELGKSWSSAAERAHVNFGKIRPVIKKWVAKYQDRCNLDEPFGGRLSAERYATPEKYTAPDSEIV